MSLDEKRSPEIIQEYFNLLAWYKSGYPLRAPEEVLNTNEQLQLNNHCLGEIQASIAAKEQSIKLEETELAQINSKISSAKEAIIGLNWTVQVQQNRLKDLDVAPLPKPFTQIQQPAVVSSSMTRANVLAQLREEATNDFRSIHFRIKEETTANRLAVVPFVLAFTLSCVVFVNYNLLFNTLLTL